MPTFLVGKRLYGKGAVTTIFLTGSGYSTDSSKETLSIDISCSLAGGGTYFTYCMGISLNDGSEIKGLGSSLANSSGSSGLSSSVFFFRSSLSSSLPTSSLL
jgi:hypothetical protein